MFSCLAGNNLSEFAFISSLPFNPSDSNGFYQEIMDGCKWPLNLLSCLAPLRRIPELCLRSMYLNKSALAVSRVEHLDRQMEERQVYFIRSQIFLTRAGRTSSGTKEDRFWPKADPRSK